MARQLTSRFHIGLGWLTSILVMSAASSAWASDDIELLGFDGDHFPTERVYLRVPDPSWITGTAEVTFSETPDAEILSALEVLRDARATATQEGEIFEGPTQPEQPQNLVSAQILGYSDQSDEGEGLFVVFLVDATTTMWDEHRDSRPAIEQTQGHIGAILRELRPSVDRAMLVRFGTETQTLVQATNDIGRVTDTVNQLQPYDEDVPSYVFDAIADTLQHTIEPVASPTLPGRRLLFVFSDGDDRGSGFPVEDLPGMMNTLTQRPVVITVGVGEEVDTAPDESPYRDLARVANFAGDGRNFLETPRSAEVVQNFQRAIEELEHQVMLEFDVPTHYWRRGEHQAVLTLRPPSGGEESVTVSIPVDLTESQEQRHAQYTTELEAAVTWANPPPPPKWPIFVGVGGGLLLIVIIASVVVSRRSKRQTLEQMDALVEVRDSLEQRIGAQESQLLGRARELATEDARQAADATRAPLAMLLAVDGPLKGGRFGILKPQCIIGRDDERCDLVFPSTKGDLSISRIHAKLSLGSGAWVATCLTDSRFSVNDNIIRNGEQYPIQFGDQIAVGKSLFQFEQP